jgi:flagellar biosynthesis chaperone FliJ
MTPFKKMNRMKPILKIRQHNLDRESNQLQAIKLAKMQAIERMRESQAAYMSSVDQLNLMRTKGMNQEASALELGIDSLRNRWASLLSEAKSWEREERIQLQLVKDLEVQMKTVEDLHEKFETNFKIDLSKNDQVSLDEYSQNRFHRRMK